MLNNNVHFEFIGFDPEHEMRNFIASVADRIHNLAPSDSFMKIAMKKGRDAVEASCRIASHSGEFVADVVSNSPLTAIQQIDSKIQQQLDEWKKRRFFKKNVGLPRSDQAPGHVENRLVPINLRGVVIPWKRKFNDGKDSDYKLVCSSGIEYYFVVDDEWTSVLNRYKWEKLQVIGLLNTSDFTLIPQKVYPKGPTGESDKVINLTHWMSRSHSLPYCDVTTHPA